MKQFKEILQHFSKKRKMAKEGDRRLSTTSISYSFIPIQNLLDAEIIEQISDELNVSSKNVEKGIKRICDSLRQDLTCCIEYPYVEPYYRDSYYNFFSKKHTDVGRWCFRISFYPNNVTKESFGDMHNPIKCYGYVTLRPTPRRVLGYSFIHPEALRNNSFVCCICSKTISVYGRLMEINGFPYCGQDSESISCAEVSLLMMLDYFSLKYNRYRQLLPSQINKILSKHSTERQLPTRGLATELMAVVLRKLGFGVRLYSREENGAEAYNDELFKDLLKTYIYSGFPLLACTNSHTFLIIGIENTEMPRDDAKLIVMDDNKSPYSSRDLNNEIISFMVPLSDHTFLDAETIQTEAVTKTLDDEMRKNHGVALNLQSYLNKELFIEHTYLTTSRSFKQHLRENGTNNELALCISLPRFIWITEFIAKNATKEGNNLPVETFIIYDATEGSSLTNSLLMAKVGNLLVYKQEDDTDYHSKRYSILKEVTDTFYSSTRNLKGAHNSWQD